MGGVRAWRLFEMESLQSAMRRFISSQREEPRTAVLGRGLRIYGREWKEVREREREREAAAKDALARSLK